MHHIQRHRRQSHAENGFTIIELMIATLIFSTILLLLTFAVIAITERYYKGVVQSQTQTTARSIMSTLTQFIQFDTPNGTTPSIYSTNPGFQWFCESNQLFVFEPYWELQSSPNSLLHQTVHAFVEGTVSACPGSSTSIGLNSGGITGVASTNQTELLGQHMRMSQLTFTSINTSAVEISLQVTYGDDDLLLPGWNSSSPTCTGRIGFQYCAISPLTTVVQPRQSS